jgi:hypothetical protein
MVQQPHLRVLAAAVDAFNGDQFSACCHTFEGLNDSLTGAELSRNAQLLSGRDGRLRAC